MSNSFAFKHFESFYGDTYYNYFNIQGLKYFTPMCEIFNHGIGHGAHV